MLVQGALGARGSGHKERGEACRPVSINVVYNHGLVQLGAEVGWGHWLAVVPQALPALQTSDTSQAVIASSPVRLRSVMEFKARLLRDGSGVSGSWCSAETTMHGVLYSQLCPGKFKALFACVIPKHAHVT